MTVDSGRCALLLKIVCLEEHPADPQVQAAVWPLTGLRIVSGHWGEMVPFFRR